ncbi:hypothetical protein BsWGS_14348 [Bradybaena similaris]
MILARKRWQEEKDHLEVQDGLHPPSRGWIMDAANFEKYLKERIKADDKTGNFGNNVSLELQKNKINLTSEVPFSRRYLKYLTKQYMKKNNLHDWQRVVASSKEAFERRYFQINQDEEEEEDD